MQDKVSKRPFPASRQLAGQLHAAGLTADYCISLMPGNGTADGKDGDHIILAPAYNATMTDLEMIVERTKRVIFDTLK